MEFLKQKYIFIALLFFQSTLLLSQSQIELQTAFSESFVLESEQKYDGAVEALLKVYDNNNYEINLRLGWLNYLAGKQEKSIQFYKKAIVTMPVAVEPLFGILNPYTYKKDWVNVEKTYLKIIKYDNKNSTANYKLGLIYYYRKNYTQAKTYFDTVLNLYPFDYDALLMSAWTNYFLGDMQNSKVLFNKVLLMNKNNSSALEGLGLIK